MDQVAVEIYSADQAAFREAEGRLNAALSNQAVYRSSAAAHRSEAALDSDKRRALFEENGGLMTHEVKSLNKRKREHLLSAEDDDETARELQPYIDRLIVEASDKANVLLQRKDIFLHRHFKKTSREEVTQFAQKLHALIKTEAVRRRNDNAHAEMAAIHGGYFEWVVADILQQIRDAFADENLEPDQIHDDVKTVLELTDIGAFTPLTGAQRHKIVHGLNNGSAVV